MKVLMAVILAVLGAGMLAVPAEAGRLPQAIALVKRLPSRMPVSNRPSREKTAVSLLAQTAPSRPGPFIRQGGR